MVSIAVIGVIAIASIIIAIFFEWILSKFRKLITSNGEAHVAHQILNLFRFVFYLFIILFDLGLVGLNWYGLLASAGFLGIVLGLAAQAPLSNLFAGFFIIFSKIIKKGDKIGIRSIGSAVELEGIVKHIGFTHTKIISKKNTLNLVPNNLIITWVIEHKPKKGQ